jgi:serine/threonine protein kinase
METERWKQVDNLLQSVLERRPEEREAFLRQACGDDKSLEGEVRSLLAMEQEAGNFLQVPVMEPDRTVTQDAPQLQQDFGPNGLTVGASLGPYRIERKLGEGGMGEVYRAVDTRLGRSVAIKIAGVQYSAHFEREARAISSLNHPHICTLYDVGPNYLVMELVDGETMSARLRSGPITVKTALLYASQILAGLAEAHSKGIVHRDLKPGNIMIATSGIKVLDFGLAKSTRDETITATGMVVGTPAYMAPEQRVGIPADVRSDIYSFGCILYEMLTGARVGTPLKRVPSRSLEKIINRCLESDPGLRWQSAADLQRELGKATANASPWRTVSAAAAIVAASAAAYAYFHRAPKLTDKDTIVLADFENKTGDAVFDDTLRQGLAVELAQSPFLTLLSDGKVQHMLPLTGQPKGARLTPEIARQICERTASTAVLEGSIALVGSQYVLGLRARNCNTGDILDQEQAVAAKREDVLNSLSRIANKFRTKAGESLATVEKHSTPLNEATTTSLEALKAYSAGTKVVVSRGNDAAIPFFRRAAEIDPKFAMAHALLGLQYSGKGESVLSAESTTRAWQLRDRVSDPERFFIDFLYDREVTGNLEKAYQTLELWYQTYPRGENPNAQGFLSGLATHGTGRYDRAIEMSQRRIASSPDEVIGYGSLASSYLLLDRFPEAEASFQRASERKLGNPNQWVMRYIIAVLRGDQEQMDRGVAQAKGKQGAEYRLAHEEALALARSGRLQAARQSSSRAMDLALQEGDRETAASHQAARAVWEAVYGNEAEAKRNAMAAWDRSNGRDVEYAAGLALAFAGDFPQAETLAGDLEKRFPEDTFAKFTYVPVLRALAALGHGKPADTVERLQITLRYELAGNGLNFNHWYLGGLHSAYVRGAALSAERRYVDAVAEFQKILDHRGIVGLDPIGVLAHLQIGRAWALAGDKGKAKAAYDAFLTRWKDADTDIPIFKQAKAEYVKLR